MSTDSGLEALEPWLAGYLARLSAGERLKLTRKIGQMLRRRNSIRIRANIQPDGTAMEPRKIKQDQRGRIRGRKGPMFPKIAMAKNLKVTARPDEVEISFTPLVAGAAKIHHWGLVGKVENTPGSIRVRYPARRLLGIPPADREAIMDEALAWLDAPR